MTQWFPLDLTNEERAFGFMVIGAPSGVRSVATAVIGRGLAAVKTFGRGPGVRYLVCNRDLPQVCPSAASLDQLRARFPER